MVFRFQHGPVSQTVSETLSRGRRFSKLRTPDCPQPQTCKRLIEGQLTLPPPSCINIIFSCALCIDEILIYNKLIGTQQGSLAQTDQSCAWTFLLPGLDAHLCTFDMTTTG